MARKVYGQNKADICVFCGARALAENKQGLPVCEPHRNNTFDDITCLCQAKLEIKKSKFGPFFVCPSCGPVSWKKGLEMRDGTEFKLNKKFRVKAKETEKKIIKGQIASEKKRIENQVAQKTFIRPIQNQQKKETVVRSDELDFLY